MFEFGVENFVSLSDQKGDKKAVGSKPVLAFIGSQWETDSLYRRLENLLLDFFRGTKFDSIALQGIDHVIVCAVNEGVVTLKAYNVEFLRSGDRVPNVALGIMGPSMRLTMRRSQIGAEDVWKASLRQPKA